MNQPVVKDCKEFTLPDYYRSFFSWFLLHVIQQK
jgi:hypothetical protein